MSIKLKKVVLHEGKKHKVVIKKIKLVKVSKARARRAAQEKRRS